MPKTPEKTNAVARPQSGLELRPSFMKPDDATGKEGLTKDDLRLPRLAIAQGLSKAMLPDDPAFIDGLKLFDMYNDLTGEIYGRGPLTFVPLRREVVRIEFDPKDANIVLDRNVPANDPRNDWDRTVTPNKPPRATKFVEFVALLIRDGLKPEPVVISIKDTNKHNRRAFDRLTTFIAMRDTPIYGGYYTVESKSEKNDKGTFGVPSIKNAGIMQEEDKDLFFYAAKFASEIAGKTINVQREMGDEPLDDFPGSDEPPVEGQTTEM